MYTYICEDDAVMSKIIADKIAIFNAKNGDDNIFEIQQITDNPMKLYEHVVLYNIKQAVYFLDINLKSEIDGIKLAQLLRKFDRKANIVFVTSFSNRMSDTFKNQIFAYDFIVKDNIEQLQRELERVLYSLVSYVAIGVFRLI